MADPPKKKTASRAEAGLVEEDAEIQPNDEAIAAGEAFPEEALEEGAPMVETLQSQVKISGMSEEEQFMNMTPVIVGPPAYGSPDPLTSGSRLLPLDEHPFNPANLPDDHPARIDEDYGKGYEGELTPSELGTQASGAPQRTDLERDQQGGGGKGEQGEEEQDYGSMSKDELTSEAEGRGIQVPSNATKAEIIDLLKS